MSLNDSFPSIEEFVAQLDAQAPVAELPVEAPVEETAEQVEVQADAPEVIEEAPVIEEVKVEATESQQGKVDEAKETRKSLLEEFNRLTELDRQTRAKEFKLQQSEKELADKRTKWEKLEKLKEEDPEAALEELGLSYDKLTERRLNGHQKPEVPEWKKELVSVQEQNKQLQEAIQRMTQERQQEKYELAKQQFLEFGKNNYDVVDAFDAYDMTEEVLGKVFREEGRNLTYDEGYQVVQKHLMDRLEKALETKTVQEFIRKKYPDWFKASQPAAKPAPVRAPAHTSSAAKPAAPSEPKEEKRGVSKLTVDEDEISRLASMWEANERATR